MFTFQLKKVSFDLSFLECRNRREKDYGKTHENIFDSFHDLYKIKSLFKIQITSELK